MSQNYLGHSKSYRSISLNVLGKNILHNNGVGLDKRPIIKIKVQNKDILKAKEYLEIWRHNND